MDNSKMETPGCNCGDNCCQPPKPKPWKKLLFALVVLAVIAIITLKLTSSSQSNTPVRNDSLTAQKAGAIDSSGTKACTKTCDPSTSSSCCPPTKK